jgi:FkbM family methyltransferase
VESWHVPVTRAAATLIRFLYPYGSERRVLRGPARGLTFVVEPGIGCTYAIATDMATPRFFGAHIRRGMTVFDVGANKGQMSLLFASLVGPSGRVVAFEPAPAEFSSLERNVALNALHQVRLIAAAASDLDGELAFSYSAERPTQGKLCGVEPTYDAGRARTFAVRALRLDDVLKEEPPPDFIKIDVEGGAGGVLRGAARILDGIGPDVYLELHGPEERASVRDELLARGYVAYTVGGAIVADPVNRWASPLWCTRARRGTAGRASSPPEQD